MRLFIYGSKCFASTVAGLVADTGHELAGMIDDQASGEHIVGSLDVVSRAHARSEAGLVMAIGYKDLPARWRAWQRVLAAGWTVPVLVHPRAYVSATAQLGAGALVMAGAIVDQRSRLGQAVVIWPGACINHDCQVGDNSFISPSAVLCGSVHVGAHSFVGAGALVVDGGELPPSSFVRMGERFTARRP